MFVWSLHLPFAQSKMQKLKKKVLPVCKPHLPMKALHIPSAKSSKHTTIHNPHMSYRTSVCTTAHTEVRQLSVGQCSKVTNLNLPQNLWGNHFLPHTKFQIVQISFEIYENEPKQLCSNCEIVLFLQGKHPFLFYPGLIFYINTVCHISKPSVG